MRELWDQTTIDKEIMQYFIVLAFVAFLITILFSGVIGIGSHFSALEIPIFQKYIIFFISCNVLLSLLYFLSLAEFENAGYLSLISTFLLQLQLSCYFFFIQPTLLLLEFKKNYTKLDSLLKKSVNAGDRHFLEEYKRAEDSKALLSQKYRIQSYQVALCYIFTSKKEEVLRIQPQNFSLADNARKRYNITSGMVIGYMIFDFSLQIAQSALIGAEEYTNYTAVVLYGCVRMILNIAFIIYFSLEMWVFFRLLRKQAQILKLSSILVGLFCFNVQRHLVDIICVTVDKKDSVNFANIVNFFMLSLENFVCSLLVLQGFSYKGMIFSEYKSIITRIKAIPEIKISDEIGEGYNRYENERSGERDVRDESTLMKHFVEKEAK